MKISVVTVCNGEPKHPYLMLKEFKQTLSNFGYTPTILGWQEEWKGLMTKPMRMLDWLESGKCTADYLIIPDAYDVLFCRSPEEVVERYKKFNCSMVIGAESNCFPEAGMACDFPQVDSPFKFLNSGFIVTTPEAELKMLQSMNPRAIGGDMNGFEPNDQYYTQLEYFKQPCSMKLDTEARLCLNLHGVENWRDYDPCVFHFNGDKSPPYKAELLSLLGL